MIMLMMGRNGNHRDFVISKADRIYRNPKFRFASQCRGYWVGAFSIWYC